jgi:hypothetical protein
LTVAVFYKGALIGGTAIPIPDVLPDTFDDLIGMRLVQFNRMERWTKEKHEKRDALDALCEFHGYIGMWASEKAYAANRVGMSFQYDVPMGKQGKLAPFRGKRIRIVCLRSGRFEFWLRIGAFSIP